MPALKMKRRFKNIFFLLIWFFSVPLHIFSQGSYRPRKDTWFSPIYKKHWDKGFFFSPGVTISLNDSSAPFLISGIFGFTMRRRVPFEYAGTTISAGFYNAARPDQNMPVRISPSIFPDYKLIILPAYLSVTFFKNGGLFVRGMGTSAPLFGFHGAYLGWEYKKASVEGTLIRGGVHAGIEKLLLPPVLALKIRGIFDIDYIFYKNDKDNYNIIARAAAEIWLVMYCF